MRKSSNGLLLGILVAMLIGLLSLLVFQSAWLKLIQYMLNSNQSSGFAVSTSPVSGFSFPTKGAAVSPGVESAINNMGITVTRVILPADNVIGNKQDFNHPDKNQQYLLVNIKVRCLSSKDTCRATEYDFGVNSSGGRDYSAEFSNGFSDLNGLFEGGDIKPGRTMSGALIFIIQKGDRGLTLVYPRMFGFGDTAQFLLGW